MPGLAIDGKKKKKEKKSKQKRQEVEVKEQEITQEQPKEEAIALGTYSVLDSIELDISDIEDDWYLGWIHDNFDETMQPMIDTLPQSDNATINSAIKAAIVNYNSGNIIPGEVNSNIVPKSMEVEIY